MFNSKVEQTVKVYLDDDVQPSYTLTGSGSYDDTDNRGTAILTAKKLGRVRVRAYVNEVESRISSSQKDIPGSATPPSTETYVGVVAVYNHLDGDNRFDDAFVICHWPVKPIK